MPQRDSTQKKSEAAMTDVVDANEFKVQLQEAKPFEAWAIVEIMGHQQFAGRVTEEPIAGQNMLRLDIPAVGDRPAHTKYFGGSSIFAIHPCSEDLARAAAERLAQSYGAALLPVAVPDLTNALETIRRAERVTAPAALTSGGYSDDFDTDVGF